MPISSLRKTDLNSGWEARLELVLKREKNKTVIRDRKTFGPLQIQKPFYPDKDGRCHVYILHPPGGEVGGDQFAVAINVGPNAVALITTPAACKFYRSSGPLASQTQEIKLAPSGVLEWFPLENIFFSGAKVKLKTRVHLARESYFFGWDICCLGRPASGEKFDRGTLDQRFEIWCQGKPIRLERFLIKGNDWTLQERWGLANKPVVASFFCFTSQKDLIHLLRQTIAFPENGDYFSLTFLNEIILCRYLGNSVEKAKELFIMVWKTLRGALLSKQAVTPRIWNT